MGARRCSKARGSEALLAARRRERLARPGEGERTPQTRPNACLSISLRSSSKPNRWTYSVISSVFLDAVSSEIHSSDNTSKT